VKLLPFAIPHELPQSAGKPFDGIAHEICVPNLGYRLLASPSRPTRPSRLAIFPTKV